MRHLKKAKFCIDLVKFLEENHFGNPNKQKLRKTSKSGF